MGFKPRQLTPNEQTVVDAIGVQQRTEAWEPLEAAAEQWLAGAGYSPARLKNMVAEICSVVGACNREHGSLSPLFVFEEVEKRFFGNKRSA